jgi:hypothetical protein
LRAQLRDTERLAGALSGALSPDTTRVVVAQSLLPFLWRAGHLGGREFDVLMTRLPLSVLHQRLDAAWQLHPERSTLGEFRAPPDLVEAEAEALSAATHLITPHTGIAQLFPGRAVPLDWHLPAVERIAPAATRRIAYPGPTAARKGAYELREAVRQLDLEARLLGAELEGADFWRGCRTERADGDWLAGVSAVVQPSLIEDNPRPLLAALAAGVPVIATPECGLGERPGVITVPCHDQPALVEAIARFSGVAPPRPVGTSPTPDRSSISEAGRCRCACQKARAGD